MQRVIFRHLRLSFSHLSARHKARSYPKNAKLLGTLLQTYLAEHCCFTPSNSNDVGDAKHNDVWGMLQFANQFLHVGSISCAEKGLQSCRSEKRHQISTLVAHLYEFLRSILQTKIAEIGRFLAFSNRKCRGFSALQTGWRIPRSRRDRGLRGRAQKERKS